MTVTIMEDDQEKRIPAREVTRAVAATMTQESSEGIRFGVVGPQVFMFSLPLSGVSDSWLHDLFQISGIVWRSAYDQPLTRCLPLLLPLLLLQLLHSKEILRSHGNTTLLPTILDLIVLHCMAGSG